MICVCVCVQLCLNLCKPMDCSPPNSSVHGVFQARILEWVAISSSRGSSRSRNWILISSISFTGRCILYYCATWEALNKMVYPNVTLKKKLFFDNITWIIFESLHSIDIYVDSGHTGYYFLTSCQNLSSALPHVNLISKLIHLAFSPFSY